MFKFKMMKGEQNRLTTDNIIIATKLVTGTNPNPTKTIDMREFPLTPDVTFTRASTATYWDASGVMQTAAANEPRPYRKATGGSILGTMSEESSTNNCLWSEDFSQASWAKTLSSITSNSRVAPNGTTTMDTLVDDTSTGLHTVSRNTGLLSSIGVPLSFSVFCSPAGRSRLQLLITDSAVNYVQATIDIVTGAASGILSGGANPYTGITTNFMQCADGNVRITLTAIPSVALIQQIQIRLDNRTTSSYTGDGVSGAYIWGAQLEDKVAPTSYIPTTTVAVTRADESLKVTGTNFTTWYNSAQGTWLAECGFDSAGLNSPNTANFIINPCDGTSANRMSLLSPASNLIRIDGVSANVLTLSATGGSILKLVNTPYKAAFNYAINYLNQAINGTLSTADTLGALPIGINQLSIGGDFGTTNRINGYVGKISYWNTQLTDARLVELTST